MMVSTWAETIPWVIRVTRIQKKSLEANDVSFSPFTRDALNFGHRKYMPRRTVALKEVLIFVLFLSLASGYENMNDHLF